MHAIFVNHCHPDCPHVCGTRAREFAKALARQGHRIVLLTESLSRNDRAMDPAALPAALTAHDWSAPFQLAVPPQRAPLLEAVRSGRMPAPLRAPIIAYQYLVRGGMFTDWRDASRRYWSPLAEAFRPDVVWGTFGNTDAWAIAQGIARGAGCPWVRDLKDWWTGFIPSLVRGHVARRFRDAAATTALAQALVNDGVPWFGGTASVIYSGIAADLPAAPPAAPSGRSFTLVLVGGIYEKASLDQLIEGINRFAAARREEASVRLIYAGTDGAAVAEAARRLDNGALENCGQLPFAAYWKRIVAADANLYVRMSGSVWHHKVVELLAARRPVICTPGETGEAHALAETVNGQLLDAPDAAAVADALEHVWKSRGTPPPPDAQGLARLTWTARATELQAVLAAAVAND